MSEIFKKLTKKIKIRKVKNFRLKNEVKSRKKNKNIIYP